MNANLSAFLYLVAGVLFILSLRGLSSPASSRQGNLFGMIGMAIAVGTTLANHPPADGLAWFLVILGLPIGGRLGAGIAPPGAQAPPEMTAKLVAQAKLLEEAGASLLDFTNSGPVAGAAVVSAVKIPVIGGFGGGPWLDGRVRLAHTAIGYGEKWIESKTETYANVARISLDAFTALIADVRGGRQIKG